MPRFAHRSVQAVTTAALILAFVPTELKSVLDQGNQFTVLVQNNHTAPIEVHLSYRTGSERNKVLVPQGATKELAVSWRNEQFYIAVRIQQSGLFDPRGGGLPRKKSYYTDLRTAEEGERISLVVPANIENDARFRSERPVF